MASLRFVAICLCFVHVSSVSIDFFLPFGDLAGDERLDLGEDVVSDEVVLTVPVSFYDQYYRSVYVSDNGYVAFQQPVAEFTQKSLPLDVPAVVVYLGNTDTTVHGLIFFRESTDDNVLETASNLIKENFDDQGSFRARAVFLVTWDFVGVKGDSESTNNYQLAIVSDDQNSFAVFMYWDDNVLWVSAGVDPFAEAGFAEGGDRRRRVFKLPGSGQDLTSKSFVTRSNVNKPGLWMYQIGRVAEIGQPKSTSDSEIDTVTDARVPELAEVVVTDTCSNKASTCHSNARCLDYPTGFCCECAAPYYGNGINCLQPGTAQRVNGKLDGSVNGYSLTNVDLHSYIVTEDGRAYTAVSRIPRDLGYSMMTLYTINGIIGWLFAVPLPKAKNGFIITGGKFNRTATIDFQSGESLTIEQIFPGPDNLGYLRMDTKIEGTIPELPDFSKVNSEDYKEEFRRTDTGVLRSRATRRYSVNGIVKQYTINQTIKYNECTAKPFDPNDVTDHRISVGRFFVVYDDRERILRFAMTNKVGPLLTGDPCQETTPNCHIDAQCIPLGTTYRCECKDGYIGNGLTCEDKDECASVEHNCDINARCLNTKGSFECRCSSGYRGDGIRCERDTTCGDSNCDTNARCVFDSERNEVRCECNQGYRGDGLRCEIDRGRTCADLNCDPNARCVLDQDGNPVQCECNPGYFGNGQRCERARERTCADLNCDPNALCVEDQDGNPVRCECNPGYIGNGQRCDRARERTCANLNCDPNAQCILDRERNPVRCECNPGYTGDGLRCERSRERTCADLNCDPNARCVQDQDGIPVRCECNPGYFGNGQRCERTRERTCADLNCDPNARCVQDQDGNPVRCECNPGYIGNGQRCERTRERTCADLNCDPNARCILDQYGNPVHCECNPGYIGNGQRCDRSQERTCADLNCDPNAQCILDRERNLVRCECNPGYTGDGRRCERSRRRTCADLNCDPNARCVEDQDGNPVRCECNPGYIGNGQRCERSRERTCADLNCDPNARCILDQYGNPVSCECNPGYIGNGQRCERTRERTCADLNCDPNAQCILDRERNPVRCECNPGYTGDGQRCERSQESTCRDLDCDRNARCVFDSEINSVRCECKPGYRGNGQRCERAPQITCNDLKCDPNARCTFDRSTNSFRCDCNPGYTGDGERCERVRFTCNEVDNCHPDAECVFDREEQQYKCECIEGFSGDGEDSCTAAGEDGDLITTESPTDGDRKAEKSCENCDTYADCIFDPNQLFYHCQCIKGFTGDGYRCYPLGDCDTADNCDPNARCDRDTASTRFRCICNEGFSGNGYRCKELGCNILRNCDENAACEIDESVGDYRCKCNSGFEGDGKVCRQLNCDQYDNCDKNARCQYIQERRTYDCVCNEGYSGDGLTCKPKVIPCNIVNNCDRNADCLYDPNALGYRCRCKQGFRGSGFRCVSSVTCRNDPSMCDENASCRQFGEGAEDSACICKPGFRGDGRNCVSISDLESYLMFTQGMSIMQVPLQQSDDLSGNMTLMVPGQTAIGIDVDCDKLYFYWTDVSGKTISKSRLDGTDSENIVKGLGSPEGIAVDWLTGSIFWTDSILDRIEVAKDDGTMRKVLIDTDLVNPRAIVANPTEGKIYWTDWNREAPKIESANMDGSNRQTIVSQDLGLPNGLAIDHEKGKLCWGDAGTQRIECSNLDGSARQIIYNLASYPFGLAMYGDKIYWTDWDIQSIQRISQYGGSLEEPLKLPPGGNGRLYGVTAVKKECPAGSSACALQNGGCRFLCLPTPNGGRTCACPDDLEDDQCNEVNLYLKK